LRGGIWFLAVCLREDRRTGREATGCEEDKNQCYKPRRDKTCFGVNVTMRIRRGANPMCKPSASHTTELLDAGGERDGFTGQSFYCAGWKEQWPPYPRSGVGGGHVPPPILLGVRAEVLHRGYRFLTSTHCLPRWLFSWASINSICRKPSTNWG
jgi:hypothetical protein